MAQRAKTTKKVSAIKESQFPLETISPKTKNQEKVFREYGAGKHLFLHGSAGTGKTFLAAYLAIKDILQGENQQRLIIVRAPKTVSQMGFLPGDETKKMEQFEAPIKSIVDGLIDKPNAYGQLKALKYIDFMSTAYVRGNTWNNAIVIMDEVASATNHELDSVITRLGENSRLIMCGDFKQTDLDKRDQHEFPMFMQIMKAMKSVSFIEFTADDIVRSGFVKEYIMTKEKIYGSP